MDMAHFILFGNFNFRMNIWYLQSEQLMGWIGSKHKDCFLVRVTSNIYQTVELMKFVEKVYV